MDNIENFMNNGETQGSIEETCNPQWDALYAVVAKVAKEHQLDLESTVTELVHEVVVESLKKYLENNA